MLVTWEKPIVGVCEAKEAEDQSEILAYDPEYAIEKPNLFHIWIKSSRARHAEPGSLEKEEKKKLPLSIYIIAGLL